MSPILIVPPAAEPVTPADAKLYLRTAGPDEDDLVIALIRAARHLVEAASNRLLVSQTWRLVCDAWPLGSGRSGRRRRQNPPSGNTGTGRGALRCRARTALRARQPPCFATPCSPCCPLAAGARCAAQHRRRELRGRHLGASARTCRASAWRSGTRSVLAPGSAQCGQDHGRGRHLQSVSDLAALDGANNFAIEGPDGPWELLSAARIDLIGPRTCRISQLLRGLAGSEPAAARRASAGALVVGVNEALVPLTTALSDHGRELAYRVVPSGLDAADPSVLEIVTTARGLPLKPLAPVHLRARPGPGGITLGGTRRSRIDGDNWELGDPPLGEAFERCQVEIFDGAVRKLSLVGGEPAWLDGTSQELADFGSARSTLDVGIAQISETAGPGFVWRRIVRVR
jgi:hypothetical protein